eukprot:14736357-Ditylum_brightwellii.AAC.1
MVSPHHNRSKTLGTTYERTGTKSDGPKRSGRLSHKILKLTNNPASPHISCSCTPAPQIPWSKTKQAYTDTTSHANLQDSFHANLSRYVYYA